MIRAFQILGHLTLWPTMYAIGVGLLIAQSLEAKHTPLSLVYIALCAHAGYMLDRIKLRASLMDEADAASLPDRYVFLRAHARVLRPWTIAAWVGAITTGWFMHPALAVLAAFGFVGTLAYAGTKRSALPRAKDLYALKALFVTAAIITLGFAPMLLTQHELDLTIDLRHTTLLGVALLVFADAMMCDLDDVTTDKQFGTLSVPVLLGTQKTKALCTALYTLAGSIIALTNHELVLEGTLLAFSGFAIMRQHNRRDWIDARMLPVTLIAAAFAL